MDDEYSDFDDELSHHGILGMKWGVRRYQNEDGSLTAEGKKRYSGLLNDHMKDHTTFKAKNGDVIELQRIYPGALNRALSSVNPKIKEETRKSSNFNVVVNGKKVGDVSLYQESDKSLNGVWLGINEEHRGKGYATAIMKNVLEYATEAGNEKFTLEVPGHSPDARHIYEKQGAKALKQISQNDDCWGGLTSMEVNLNPKTSIGKKSCEKILSIEHSDYLAHHGILGMKWGVRRYQNEDGSWTEEGKKHRSDIEGSDRIKQNAKKAAIIAGVAIGTVAVGYALYKTGYAQKGIDAISNMFNNGLGNTPANQPKLLNSKGPSKATRDILDANKKSANSFKTNVSRSNTKKTSEDIFEAASNFRKTSESSAKQTGSTDTIFDKVAGYRKKTSGNSSATKFNERINTSDFSKQSKRYSKSVKNATKRSKRVSTFSSKFKSQADKYVNITDDLINKFKKG